MDGKLGLAHFWAQGDAVSHAVAIALFLMSVVSWYLIFGKALAQLRSRVSITRAMQWRC